MAMFTENPPIPDLEPPVAGMDALTRAEHAIARLERVTFLLIFSLILSLLTHVF